VLAVCYLVGAVGFGVAGFANFPVWTVAATVLMFAVVPLALLWLLGRERGSSRWTWATSLSGLLGGLFLLVVHTASLLAWSDYYSNFSYERLDTRDGYHNDSAFHVAIIQGILRSGYPTTSQHFEPLIHYHSLSHFFDALALRVLPLDPWESYALLFFAKGTAVMLGVVFFAAKVTQNHRPTVFYVVLGGVVLTVTATWRIIGSHGEWFPFLVLILSAPWVAKLLRWENAPGSRLVTLTGLVAVLSLGKISLGFAFAAVAGLWLLFSNPRDIRIYGMGSVWVAFFAIFGSSFGESALDVSAVRFRMSWPEMSAIVMLVAVCFVMARASDTKLLRNAAMAGMATFLVIVGLTILELRSETDAFYFFHGLYLSLFLLTIPFLIDAFAGLPPRQATSTSEANLGLRTVSLAMTILSVSGPVLAGGQFYSPFSNWEAMAVSLAATNTVTYKHYNGTVPSDQARSVATGLVAPRLSNTEPDEGYFREMGTELRRVIEDSELGDREPLLLLSQEDFAWLAVRAGTEEEDSWSVGLLVTAITGLPLLHGVEGPVRQQYAFQEYGFDALQLPKAETDARNLCAHARPVIAVVDIEKLRFRVLCSARSTALSEGPQSLRSWVEERVFRFGD
jgi:hypothetical protein